LASNSYIKNVKPNDKYKYGYFIPNNPEKYTGDLNNILYRSSWEFYVLRIFDQNPRIISYCAEPFSIKYLHPFAHKYRNYYIDAYAKILNARDEVIEWIFEIKPNKYTRPPTPPKNPTPKANKNYNHHAKQYIVNCKKFEAAKEYARSKGMKFGIITESFLFNKLNS
jgi:hypothetical protein